MLDRTCVGVKYPEKGDLGEKHFPTQAERISIHLNQYYIHFKHTLDITHYCAKVAGHLFLTIYIKDSYL